MLIGNGEYNSENEALDSAHAKPSWDESTRQ